MADLGIGDDIPSDHALGHLALLVFRHCEYLKHNYGQVSPDRSPFAALLCGGVDAALCHRIWLSALRSYSALNSQPTRAMAEIRYIHTSSAMPAPTEPYITL